MKTFCECIFCISDTLAAGTSQGRIAVWRMVHGGGSRGDAKVQWKLQTPTEIGGNVVQLQVRRRCQNLQQRQNKNHR